MIIISDCLTDHADEGTIKIASKLAKILKQNGAKVFQLNSNTSFCDKSFNVNKLGISKALIRQIKNEDGAILYIPNASMTNSICLKVLILSVLSGRKVFLLPVYRREVTSIMKFLLELSKSDLVVLSEESYKKYKEAVNNSIHYVKAGVDFKQFKPVSQEEKKKIREKLGFASEEKIALHVGHMVEARNIRKLVDVAKYVHVVLVVSMSTRWDEALYSDLKDNGNITIIHEYISNIEEYYQMADAYVFCVESVGCVDVPLSVLEAAACNIPVVTTKYGELMTFNENSSFSFIDSFDNIGNLVTVACECENVNNRKMISEYDWSIAANKLEEIVKG